MKRIQTIITYILIFESLLSFSCISEVRVKGQAVNPEKEGMITIQVTVLEYLPFAFHSEIEGWPDQWLDGSRVKITQPAVEAAEIIIYHNEPVPQKSLWRKNGAVVTVKLPETYLHTEPGKTVQIFIDKTNIP